MKNIIFIPLALVLTYSIISSFGFLIGVVEGDRGPFFSSCTTELERIEYIFPAYRFGCYMGSNKDWSEIWKED